MCFIVMSPAPGHRGAWPDVVPGSLLFGWINKHIDFTEAEDESGNLWVALIAVRCLNCLYTAMLIDPGSQTVKIAWALSLVHSSHESKGCSSAEISSTCQPCFQKIHTLLEA